MDDATRNAHLAEIDEQGFTILEGAIEPDLVVELRDTLRRYHEETAASPRNTAAEGWATLRSYNLLSKGEVFQQVPVHPEVLPFAENLLGPECLISGMTAMDIGPTEKPQALHADDVTLRIPKPHVPLMVTTIWALTDFTAENGGTRVVPGSHRWEDPDYTKEYETQPTVMKAGSVLVLHGSTWHSGGGNVTDGEWRLGINMQYCAGFIRQQQAQTLAIPVEVAQTFDERLLRLCGYTLFLGIMGHVDGKSPGAALGIEAARQTAYAPNDDGAG